MSKGQRTIAGLLVIVAALLGAQAFTEFEPPPVPTVVGGAVTHTGTSVDRIYRFWSDGSVDMIGRSWDGSGDMCDLFIGCGPVVIE